MKIAVFGAGAWGTALAVQAARTHDVHLWARDPRAAQDMAQARVNRRYLPEVELPSALGVDADFDAAVAHAQGGLAVIATPMAALRETLARLPVRLPVLWLCKGFEAATGLLGHEIAAELRPHGEAGVLSGPSFALEVALGQPTALVVASAQASLCERAVQAFHGEMLRVYSSDDPVGVEVGGAVKNVLAIATGVCDGLFAHAGLPGENARAALITRGLAEMTRLGVALGARPETFMGLSGLGDLVLTATGERSRNRQVGLGLAQGRSLDEVLSQLGHVAEGVYSAHTVMRRAASVQVEMPIADCVVALLSGTLTPFDAVQALMGRDARAER